MSSGATLVPPPELVEALRGRDRFLLATHVNPDGDAIGSAIALAMALEQLGKKVTLLDKHSMPEQYAFLPGLDRFYTYEKLQAAGFTPGDFETLLIVDCNHPERIGLEQKEQRPSIEPFKQAVFGGMYSIVVDHHQTGNGFGNIRWIMPLASATGLMVYCLIKTLGVTITPDMARNLYTAVLTDTGNFHFENVSAGTFRAAAELIDLGAVPYEIYEDVYESYPDNRFRLYLNVIGTLEIENSTAVLTVTKKMLEETSTLPDDVENFVSFPRIMKDIKVSVLIREIGPQACKVSLRSKGSLDVSGIAEQFRGGGHKNAAGCTIRADIVTAKKMILEKIKELKAI
jgi:phosphoesterase RecJ-like protein